MLSSLLVSLIQNIPILGSIVSVAWWLLLIGFLFSLFGVYFGYKFFQIGDHPLTREEYNRWFILAVVLLVLSILSTSYSLIIGILLILIGLILASNQQYEEEQKYYESHYYEKIQKYYD